MVISKKWKVYFGELRCLGNIFLSSGAYTDIERRLLDDFKKAHFEGDVEKMKSLANTLSNFKVLS